MPAQIGPKLQALLDSLPGETVDIDDTVEPKWTDQTHCVITSLDEIAKARRWAMAERTEKPHIFLSHLGWQRIAARRARSLNSAASQFCRDRNHDKLLGEWYA